MTTQLPPTRLCRGGGGGRMAVTILAVALVAACGGGSGAQTSTIASAQTQPSAPAVPPTTAAIAKPCLRAAESTRMFRFKTSEGATLVGVVLGTGRTGLVLGHQLRSDLCEWLRRGRSPGVAIGYWSSTSPVSGTPSPGRTGGSTPTWSRPPPSSAAAEPIGSC
jgi:hypothetical protein